MFVLFAGAYFILPMEIPVSIRFIGIVTFIGLASYPLYEFIIKRIGFLRPLFELKVNSNKKGIIQNENIHKNI